MMTFIKLKLWRIVPIFVILMFGSTPLVTFAQSQTLNKTYANDLCGLSINYPDDWMVEESNTKYEEGQSSLVVMAEISPNVSDRMRSTVQLEAEGMSGYRDKSFEEIIDFLESFYDYPGTTIIQSERTNVQGKPAYEIVYEETLSSGEIWKKKEVYIPFESTMYVIRYDTVGTNYYDKYISIVDDMIQTVKVDGRAC
jgi:hypothetical protein